MKLLPFEPRSPLEFAFACELEVGSIRCRLDVFGWDDRLVACEKEGELWWCTLDACGGRDVREFWHECVANERVGRLYSVERHFQQVSPSGAILELGPYEFYIVASGDNSGIACVHSENRWHSFPSADVPHTRSTLAARPTIWSRGFCEKFVLRSFSALGTVFEADALAQMPASVRELWSQGAGALPIRLLAAALAFGWANSLRGTFTTAQFWQGVLSARPHFSAASNESVDGLLHSPEAALPGQFTVPHFIHPKGKPPATFIWRHSTTMLCVGFRSWNESEHDLREHRLEVRDWLARFFSRAEVEAIFSSGVERNF